MILKKYLSGKRKRSVGFGAVSLLLFAGLMLCGACKGKNGNAAETPPAVETPPIVEAQRLLPAIEKRNAGILVVYRHTEFGYIDSYGFDTLVFRFSVLPNGWLEGATVYEQRVDGEKEISKYGFNYVGADLVVTETSENGSRVIANIVLSPGKMELGGTVERIVSLSPEEGLLIRSVPGDYREEYSIARSGAKEGKVVISRDGAVETEGLYTFPEKGKVVYTERSVKDATGAEASTISLWLDGKGDYRFRTEGVEPVNEVYASGFKTAFSGEYGMQNLALVDLVLGRSRNMRPVLAYALSEAIKPR